MGYNSVNQEFINSLTKDNCPVRWIEQAKVYKNRLDMVDEDMRRVYRHILQNILNEDKIVESKEVNFEEEVKLEEDEIEVESEEEDNF